MVSLTREGDREYVWLRARSQPRSATTAGYFPFATCARRGLRKGAATVQYEDTIEIRGVTVMRQTDVALLCRMGNQHRWIAPTQLQPGSTVARPGDVGIVVLKRPFAVEQGLVPFQGLHD